LAQAVANALPVFELTLFKSGKVNKLIPWKVSVNKDWSRFNQEYKLATDINSSTHEINVFTVLVFVGIILL
jgi:hypothetical protein